MTRSVLSPVREGDDDATARLRRTCDLPNGRSKDQIGQGLLSRNRALGQWSRRILRTKSRCASGLPAGRIWHSRESALRVWMGAQCSIATLLEGRTARAAPLFRFGTERVRGCRSHPESQLTVNGSIGVSNRRGRASVFMTMSQSSVTGFSWRCARRSPLPWCSSATGRGRRRTPRWWAICQSRPKNFRSAAEDASLGAIQVSLSCRPLNGLGS